MANPSASNIGASIALAHGVSPQAVTTATNGTGFDRTGYGSCVLSVSAGAATGAPTSWTLDAKLQHSSDNSAWADVPAGVASAAITQMTSGNSNANSTFKKSINLNGVKQYVRVVLTPGFVGGTSPTLLAAATVVLGGAVTKPASSDN
jgi:hypothetical protein